MYIYMYLCISLVSYGWINVLLYERNQNLVVQYLCGLEFCKMYKFMKTVLLLNMLDIQYTTIERWHLLSIYYVFVNLVWLTGLQLVCW